MHISDRAAVVLLATLATLALAPVTVPAATVSSAGAPSGLPAGTKIGSTTLTLPGARLSKTATQYSNCDTGSLSAHVGTSGAFSVAATSLSLPLTNTTPTSNCVNAGLPFIIRSLQLTSYGSASIHAGGTGDGQLKLTGVVMTAFVSAGGLPGTCNFNIPTAVGVITNPTLVPAAPNRVKFTAVPVTTTSGACAFYSPYTLSAEFANLRVIGGPFDGQQVSVD